MSRGTRSIASPSSSSVASTKSPTLATPTGAAQASSLARPVVTARGERGKNTSPT